EFGNITFNICPILRKTEEFGNITFNICPILRKTEEFGNITFNICPILRKTEEFGNITFNICLILRKTTEFGNIILIICLFFKYMRLCPYNCVKEKSHSHPHDTIILDQQNFVGGNENDSTQFYLKLRRTKRTNY